MEDFISFLRNPSVSDCNERSFGRKIFFFIKFYLFSITILVLCALISGYICKLIMHIDGSDLVGNYRVNLLHVLKNYGRLSVLIVGIIAPLVEEILFRLQLRPTKNNFHVSIGVWAIQIVYFLLKFHFQVPLLLIATSLLLLAMILILKWWSDQGGYIGLSIYISTILFGFLHIINFSPFTILTTFCTPLIILPQLWIGFRIAYLRLRLGFFWGLGLHITLNLPIVLVMYILLNPIK